MKCTDVREWMLEAELAELTGAAPPAVAEHLAGCAPCRAAAARIVEQEAALARAVQGLVPSRSWEAVVADAHPAKRARWWPALVPLAAAAGLGALLLARSGPDLEPYVPTDRQPPRFAVEAPPGVSVAVFETNNPNITVVWFQ